MALVLVRETTGNNSGLGSAIAAGHRGQCARKLADEHERYEGARAIPTTDPSRATNCNWCYRPADYEA